MEDMTTLPGGSHGGAGWKRMICPAGQIALLLAISLALLRLPVAPPVVSGLDASWSLCLPYLFQHGMQFGSGVVFTFGPLGFVMSSLYCGAGFWLQVAAQAAISGMFAWILATILKPLNWPAKITAILGVILLIAQNIQILYLLMIACVGVLILRDKGAGIFRIAFYSTILGFVCLTKFTNFMLAAAVAAIATGYYMAGKNWRGGLLVAGAFGVAFPAWWIGCGQSLYGLKGYLLNSLEVSKGFEDAMFINEKAPERFLGFAVLLLIAACALFEAAAARRSARNLAIILIFCAGTYLSWKHAFIRADPGHMSGLYLWALSAVLLNPLFFPYWESGKAIKIGLLTAIGLSSVAGIYWLDPAALRDCVPSFVNRLRINVNAFANPQEFKRELEARFAEVAARNGAPRIVKAVGRESVDVLGFEQSVAIFNGLHYTPRPVFQSYAAFTPGLAALNAAFLAGDQAPQWILQRYECTDHRYPSTDDALALRVLLDRYTYQFEDSGYLVWRLATDKDKTLAALPPTAREGDASINQSIPVGDIAANSQVWLEVDYALDLAGSLRELFYKPPMVTLEVTTEDQPDAPMKYRFPRLLARGGTLLSPYLAGQYEFLRYAAGLGGPKVLTFKVHCDRDEMRYLKRTFHYRLRILPDPYNLAANRAAADRSGRYPMFGAVPSRVEAAK